jgi:hypothetical protein
MPIPAYPLGLRSILRASKSRSQPAPFQLAQPRRGYAYAQAIGTDTPVFWDVSFIFNEQDAVLFSLWLKYTLKGGLLEFTMPLRTEFGQIEHVCRFLPDGLGDCVESGQLFTYQAKIMARAQVVPQAYQDAADLIVGIQDWPHYGSLLDQAIHALPNG